MRVGKKTVSEENYKVVQRRNEYTTFRIKPPLNFNNGSDIVHFLASRLHAPWAVQFSPPNQISASSDQDCNRCGIEIGAENES